MNRLKPSVLLIGVGVCVLLLALHVIGVFKELSEVMRRLYGEHLVHAGDLRPAILLQYGYYTLMAFLSAWICVELPRFWQKVAFVVGLCFLTVTFSATLALRGWLLEPFSGLIATIFAGVLGIAFSGSERGARRHRFRQFFVGRISSDVFDQLIDNREPVKLTGKREVTSLTCRIINTSELTDELEAVDVEQMNSAFLKAVSEFLVQRGAYLDVCNSQGITAQFGFPVADPEHALKACRLGLELRDILTPLADELEKRWKRKPVLGIALASGPASGGLIGYGSFQFYSVLGEAPELSRRLCNMNGVYGSRLLIAASTFNAVKDSMEVRPMEMIAAPGKTGLREVYELLAEKGTLTQGSLQARDAFWQGVVALRQGDATASLEKLRQALVVGQDDPPLRYFKERAESLAKAGSGTDTAKPKVHARKSEETS